MTPNALNTYNVQSANAFVGIDIGGTKMASALVDINTGHILCETQVATQKQRPTKDIITDIHKLLSYHLEFANIKDIPVKGCGIAFPELVNNSGEIVSDWNFDLRSLSHSDFPLNNVLFESDVRVAGLAEAKLGAGKPYQSFVYVSLGTGLAYTLFNNGVPWRGKNGYAIHFASSALTGCTADMKPLNYLPEALVSGAGLLDCWNMSHPAQRYHDLPELLLQAEMGASKERQYIKLAGEVLGSLLAQMVNMLDPEAIIFGGGLGCAQGLYHHCIEATLRDRIWAEDCKTIPVHKAYFASKAGTIGAALAASKMAKG
ncbi:ROK family protein [Vibrio penaeicida]|uniref:Glucokinase n=1 Tax=Vibrio penaeicida TaxID=104609 RepID=A0AAV5P0C5_9VIBR|nr:ROK family protein [Vibrio penaeicida]RTZ23731.1 ROK family protein [Vibrio penaeicida]GLQ75691.1 glucokinase [Vibrio penaeicida]